jgi:hypothetical protein
MILRNCFRIPFPAFILISNTNNPCYKDTNKQITFYFLFDLVARHFLGVHDHEVWLLEKLYLQQKIQLRQSRKLNNIKIISVRHKQNKILSTVNCLLWCLEQSFQFIQFLAPLHTFSTNLSILLSKSEFNRISYNFSSKEAVIIIQNFNLWRCIFLFI